jgi:CheY-like chemotaxis protein
VKSGRLNILLIDDDPNEVPFVGEALKRAGAGDTVHGVSDGQQAIAYLRGENSFRDRQRFPFPNVILCALRNPRMGGFDFLRWRGEHPECSVIPILIYSGSAADEDVREAYRLGANSYIIKPQEVQEMADTLQDLYKFWSMCEIPDLPGSC